MGVSPKSDICADWGAAFSGAALGTAMVGVSSISLIREVNCISVKISASSSRLGSSITSFSSSKSTGTLSSMVASFFESIICSWKLTMFSFCFPFSLSALASRFSTLPHSPMSLQAVFSPTPGTPGMLSLASPQSARMSISCVGSVMPYCSQISFGPRISISLSPFLGLYMRMWSVTSCP